MRYPLNRTVVAAAAVLVMTSVVLQAQQALPTPAKPVTAPAPPAIPPGVAPPVDYVIGPEDVLSIIFWRDKEMSADVVVRPDGKVSLPLINEMQAAGLTPEQLRASLTEVAGKLIEEPTVSVVVRQINSRRVFITGMVSKPGPYALGGPTTVLQLIATSGGLLEYADKKNIRIMRTENGKSVSLKFNYNDVVNGKKLQQNILLKPGDTVIVR